MFTSQKPTLKTRIIQAKLLHHQSVSNLARSYNISKNTIYKWLRQHREEAKAKTITNNDSMMAMPQFVEVAVKEPIDLSLFPSLPSSPSSETEAEAEVEAEVEVEIEAEDSTVARVGVGAPVLRKASLSFDNFSIALEGKLSSTKLIAILRVLGRQC